MDAITKRVDQYETDTRDMLDWITRAEAVGDTPTAPSISSITEIGNRIRTNQVAISEWLVSHVTSNPDEWSVMLALYKRVLAIEIEADKAAHLLVMLQHIQNANALAKAFNNQPQTC